MLATSARRLTTSSHERHIHCPPHLLFQKQVHQLTRVVDATVQIDPNNFIWLNPVANTLVKPPSQYIIQALKRGQMYNIFNHHGEFIVAKQSEQQSDISHIIPISAPRYADILTLLMAAIDRHKCELAQYWLVRSRYFSDTDQKTYNNLPYFEQFETHAKHTQELYNYLSIIRDKHWNRGST